MYTQCHEYSNSLIFQIHILKSISCFERLQLSLYLRRWICWTHWRNCPNVPKWYLWAISMPLPQTLRRPSRSDRSCKNHLRPLSTWAHSHLKDTSQSLEISKLKHLFSFQTWQWRLLAFKFRICRSQGRIGLCGRANLLYSCKTLFRCIYRMRTFGFRGLSSTV